MIENMTRRYTDIGELACHSPYVGSYNHYQQDSNTFAEWGVDYVKFDGQSVCARVFYLYLCVCVLALILLQTFIGFPRPF